MTYFYPMANPNDPIGSTNNVSFQILLRGHYVYVEMLLDTSAIESPTDPPNFMRIHGDGISLFPSFI
ncbi:MAG: hypothetical protein IPG89_17850 [Bacteroidetes bacterium]|nr:hypothetical protein [Bacteroidota bacterium]